MLRFVSIAFRAGLCLAIIGAGVLIQKTLVSMKKPPEQSGNAERAIRVEVQKVSFQDVQKTITGHGEVRSKDTVSIAPEVGGRIVRIHPKLESGEIIPAREVLFEIDPRDYQARYDESQSSIAQLTSAVARLEKQFQIDEQRLKTYDRSKTLAKDEYERVKKLYTEQKVGTQSQVDNAEMMSNNSNDSYDQLSQALDLFPIRIQEAKSNLASVTSMATLAKTSLERTKVTVPFDARVKEVQVEEGQYVSPGSPILTLADDSVLELSIPLDSKDARQWIQFDETHANSEMAWFRGLVQVPVSVHWTEGDGEFIWSGMLHRVEKFDPQTRHLSVVVRLAGTDSVRPLLGNMPLVEGMFCKVEIPGHIVQNTVKVPTEAVGFEIDENGYQHLHIAAESEDSVYRLKTVKVKQSHIDGDYSYITEGLNDGDFIITTRLINPLENSLLNAELMEFEETD